MRIRSLALSAARLSVFIKMELPRRLLIGLSGGADSVALAYLLLQVREQQQLDLRAVHVNHGLRGEASDGDEAFVRSLCAAWQLPLEVYRAQPPEHPGEDWARQARYGFYREAMEKFGAEAIALAHHRDDQAETFLLHLLRGAGMSGLTGMAQDSRVLGVRVIRPLLETTRQELRQMLEEAGIAWREDASNQDTRYLRNALRHELIPLMERLAPGATQRVAAAAELLQEEDRTLDDMARAVLQDAQTCLPLERLQGLHPGLLRRVLRLWWQHCAGSAMEEHSLNRQQTEALVQLAEATAGSKCNLPGNRHGYRGWTHLHLLGCGMQKTDVTLETAVFTGETGDGKTMQAMPRNLLEQCEVRTRRQGDWIRPFGQDGRQSLQDYFVNKRLDAPFRDAVPLLCRGSEVLLAAGVGAGKIPPVNETEETIMVRWRGEMPWAQR